MTTRAETERLSVCLAAHSSKTSVYHIVQHTKVCRKHLSLKQSLYLYDTNNVTRLP